MSLCGFLNNKVKYFKFPFPPRVQAGIRAPEKKTIILYRKTNRTPGHFTL